MKYKDYLFNCDSLWKLWYSVLVILVQMLIIALAISNYMTFRSQAFNPRFGGEWYTYPMYIQLSVIIVSISILIFLIYSCVFKVGNIANDGVELGLDPASIQKALDDISTNKGFKMLISRFKSHLLPYNCLIHVVIALLTLLPVPLMQAEQIRNEVMAKKWMWQTDLDFMVNPYARYLPSVSKAQAAVVLQDNNDDEDLLCLQSRPCRYPITPASIQPEHINLIVALLIITIRVASPFWYTNKAFSIVFSVYAFITSVCIVFSYQSVHVFVKIAHNRGGGGDEEGKVGSPWWVLVLFLMKSLLMCSMTLLVFEYGYSQYIANMRKYRQYFNYDMMSDSVSQQSLGARSDNMLRWLQAVPRVSALVVLLLVVVVDAPLVMALIRLLQSSTLLTGPLPAAWLGPASSALYLVVSVFFWFGLCMKSDWCFRINLQTSLKVGQGGGIGAGAGRGVSATESPEPVYGCFYTAPASLTSSQSGGATSGRGLRSSLDGGGSSLGTRNYVYLQPATTAAIQERMAASMMMAGAAGSEVSCGSNPRSYDSYDGFSRYKPGSRVPECQQGPYSTLAALKAGAPAKRQESYSVGMGGMKSRPSTVHSESSASSMETPSGCAAVGPSFSRSSTRRGSNRVTFREEHNVTIDSGGGAGGLDLAGGNMDYFYAPRPDILDNTHVPGPEGAAFFPQLANDEGGHHESDSHGDDEDDDDDDGDDMDKFHPDLEMSTDMRQMKEASSSDKDPRMCSQV